MTIKVEGLDKVVTNLDKFVRINPKATKDAMNDTAKKARTASLKLTREKWNIRAKDYKKQAKFIKRARVNDLNTIFTMKTQSIPLMTFAKGYKSATTDTGRNRKGGAGVRYKLLRKQRGNRVLGKSFVRKSKFNGGRLEVFTHRKSPQGADITAQYAITPTSMFNQDGLDEFVRVFKDSFNQRYIGRVRYLLG
jgi:hypothetical protein